MTGRIVFEVVLNLSVPPKGKVSAPPGVSGIKWPPGPNPAFNFTRLGVRVPTILISAW